MTSIWNNTTPDERNIEYFSVREICSIVHNMDWCVRTGLEEQRISLTDHMTTRGQVANYGHGKHYHPTSY
jgi:aspartate carbamoyltransferase catalytic subunit